MTETSGSAPSAEPRCPWCSSVVTATAERCPSCGAALRDASTGTEDAIPGVTQVDPVLGMRRQVAKPNRLVGWLADVDTEPAPPPGLAARSTGSGDSPALEGVDAASIAPPSDEVRREMRRLELEALKAELEERVADARLAALDAGETPPGDGAAGGASSEAAAPDSPRPDAEGAPGG